MFGQKAEERLPEAEAYDLSDIQTTGELIAVTLSGPTTYYEYRGQGFGLQYELTEAFAHSIGTRLRMEMATDTADLLRRLSMGEADLIALDFTEPTAPSVASSDSVVADTVPHDTVILNTKVTLMPGIGWVVRPTSPLLASAVSSWYTPTLHDQLLAAERQRQSAGHRVRRHARPQMLSRANGSISSYDDLFIRHASAIGWDWRLLAAQCYQESAFDPQAVSWAGAQGLMQIMPATAEHLGLPRSDIFNPESNIAAAARYLAELSVKFDDIPDARERICFVLAAYNGGAGHVRDAMALASKHGHNPHRWSEVDPYILALAQPRFYRDPIVQYGYLRGSETSEYVSQIQYRWASYRGVARPAPMSSHAPKPSTVAKPSKRVRPSTPTSRIRSRDTFWPDSVPE